MSFDLVAVQRSLTDDQLDGWLLYDFHGSNSIATKLVGLTGRHTTRRWYYFVPSSGSPSKLVHAIEPAVLDEMPGRKDTYAGRLALEDGVRRMLHGARIVAMEYSANAAIPYVSRVDAGTVEF